MGAWLGSDWAVARKGAGTEREGAGLQKGQAARRRGLDCGGVARKPLGG